MTCCSHSHLPCLPRAAGPCNSDTAYHVGLFAMTTNGILFPGEHVFLDVYVASSLRLLSDVRTTGLQQEHHHPHRETWPETHILPRLIAVAPSPLSEYGALVTVMENRPTLLRYHNFVRFHVIVVGRYKRISEVQYHRAYPCIRVSLICDIPHVPLSHPVDKAFPYLSPSPRTRVARATKPMLTRSLASALRNRPRLRSSAHMGGLSYVQWRSLQPDVLLRRARKAAAYARLKFDHLMIEHAPSDRDCPGRWSFWLSAGLAEDTPEHILFELLSDTSVVSRLRKLIDIFEQMRIVSSRKRCHSAAQDKAYHRPTTPKKRSRTGGKASSAHAILSTENSSRTPGRPIPPIDDVLDENPWPCSPAKGFQNVNLEYPCRGRFQPIRPHLVIPARAKEHVKSASNPP